MVEGRVEGLGSLGVVRIVMLRDVCRGVVVVARVREGSRVVRSVRRVVEKRMVCVVSEVDLRCAVSWVVDSRRARILYADEGASIRKAAQTVGD